MHKQDDIVVVKFPFTEATEFKKRPALASGSTTNDYYVYDAGGNVLAVYPEDDNATGVDNVEFPIYAASKVGTYYAEKNQTDGYDNSISYEVTDHLGNVRSLINKKEDVTTTQSFDYYAYGGYQPTRQLVNTPRYRHSYQGQYAEKDGETGTLHFDLRDYDPLVPHWLSTDPMNQHWSPYMAMGNNPIWKTDPTGGVAYKALALNALNVLAGGLEVFVGSPTVIAAIDGSVRMASSSGLFVLALDPNITDKQFEAKYGNVPTNLGAWVGAGIDVATGNKKFTTSKTLGLANDVFSLTKSTPNFIKLIEDPTATKLIPNIFKFATYSLDVIGASNQVGTIIVESVIFEFLPENTNSKPTRKSK